MSKPYLNFIVTHYNEPWEIGKSFFDMLDHQLSLDMSKISVTLVQDGEENALPWKSLLCAYRFKVKVITIPHSGTAAARNAGLDATDAEWVMFCNFDDCLADVASANLMTDVLPTNEYDIIWCKVVRQTKWHNGDIYLNCISEATLANTDGKMYRTKFLKDKNIRFFSKPRLHYDHMFNSIAIAETQPFRIATLTTDIYPYAKVYRNTGIRHTQEGFNEFYATIFEREYAIVRELRRRNLEFAFKRAVARTICLEFYGIYAPDNYEQKDQMSPGFLEFYRKYKPVMDSLPASDIEVAKSDAETEQHAIIQNRYNEHKQEYYFRNDNISFELWLSKLLPSSEHAMVSNLDQSMAQVHSVPVQKPMTEAHKEIKPVQLIQPSSKDSRVVVYCGTYNVYVNMVASLKSLLCNTPVDKVYFVIEDDVFPYDLPDIVETINVKNQNYFPADGPNYSNCWTYMCMIRAAFPEMFPQYDKILSLDIDVVINDNVSDLWDYDLTNYYLAGVPEKQRQKSSADPIYINFGVVMMNLQKLRENNLQSEIIDLLNTRKVDCPEQTAYNTLCANNILELPADYNYTAYSHITGEAQKERIIHYAGQKFWRHYSTVKQYADLGWEEVMRKQNKLKEVNDNG